MDTWIIKFKRIISEFLIGVKYFNLKVAFAKIRCIVQDESISSLQFKNRIILNYLEKQFRFLIDTYQNKHEDNHNLPLKYKAPIWVMWWQGEENMPPIIKSCHKSKLMHSNGHPVILIHKDNKRDYVKFPDYVWESFENNKIKIQHLSDMARIKLIREYGGLWLDASIFCTKDIPEYIFDFPLYSLKKEDNPQHITNDKWTTFVLGGCKNNLLCCFLDDFFMSYCKTGKPFIDYFMFDCAIALAKSTIPEIDKLLDDIDFEEGNYRWINQHISDVCDADLLLDMKKYASVFCKIAWKLDISTLNEKSLYYYIVDGEQDEES